MTNAFRRSLVSGLIACAFGLGASVALAADAATASPSSNATTPSPTSDQTGSTSATTTGTGDTTTSGSTANPPARPSSAQTPNGATPADNPARRVFDQLDTNHDGSLSFEEFSRAVIQQK